MHQYLSRPCAGEDVGSRRTARPRRGGSATAHGVLGTEQRREDLPGDAYLPGPAAAGPVLARARGRAEAHPASCSASSRRWPSSSGELIRERTVAGLKAARARGRKGGRKFALSKGDRHATCAIFTATVQPITRTGSRRAAMPSWIEFRRTRRFLRIDDRRVTRMLRADVRENIRPGRQHGCRA